MLTIEQSIYNLIVIFRFPYEELIDLTISKLFIVFFLLFLLLHFSIDYILYNFKSRNEGNRDFIITCQ